MDKMISTARKLDVFFKVVRTVCCVAAIVCLVMVGIVVAGDLLNLAPEMVGTGYAELEVGGFTFSVSPEYMAMEWNSLRQAAAVLAMGAVAAFLAWKGLGFVRAMLAPMKEGKPFHQDVSANLRKLGFLSIILGVWVEIIKIVNQVSLIAMWDLENLLLSEKVTHVGVNIHADLSFLLVAAALFLLGYVFRYGTELQTLSDETL